MYARWNASQKERIIGEVDINSVKYCFIKDSTSKPNNDELMKWMLLESFKEVH